MSKKHTKLLLPAIRAYIGDWIYYVSVLKMGDIAERVSLAEEIHSSKSLNEMIQRFLSDRAPQICEYLEKQDQRFFNSIVIGVYEGSPSWNELEVKISENFPSEKLPKYIDGMLGFISLEGNERLFAIDGQHRLLGIRRAVKKNRKLEDEELSAIFVAHRNDEDGMKRTRRLFTTLNRYAKPVSKMEGIALDEDDIIAILTRKLADKYSLFREKTSMTIAKSIQAADKKNFTTIVTIYDVVDIYLRDRSEEKWKNYKKLRPEDEEVERYWKEIVLFFDTMIKYSDPLNEIQLSDAKDEIAGKYRNEEGGNLLFRPIGLQIISSTIKRLMKSGTSLKESMDLVMKIPMDLSNDIWVGLIWDEINKRMITSPENQKTSVYMIINSIGKKMGRNWDQDRLRRELAGILNKEIEEIKLPKFI